MCSSGTTFIFVSLLINFISSTWNVGHDRLDPTTPHSYSVLGIIAIPGMMTGAILGGSSVQQAARLQMVIMFMISASAALASIAITLFTLLVVVDSEHRIRSERIDKHDHFVWRARDRAISRVMRGVKGLVLKMRTNARAKELEGYEAISIPSRR